MLRWALAVLLAAPLAFSQKWNLQYFYDEAGSQLELTGLAFPSAERGIAIGAIYDRDHRKPRFTALVTSDGGAKWALVPLKEFPRSIFFLNDSTGWMVTTDGLWFTQESGRSWTRIADQIKPDKKLGPTPPGGLILRVWFLNTQHGFAVGFQKAVFETQDGGRTWKPVAEAAKPESKAEYTLYTQIAFADDKHGIIGGSYSPPESGSELPEWMEPERTLRKREVPRLLLELTTPDGGATWASGTAPIVGSLADLHLAGTSGLAVFQYTDSFEWPSEVFRLDLTTAASASVFKQKDRRITSAVVYPGQRAFLGAVEPQGSLRSSPIPGKVKILSTSDLKDWQEMKVDYRAVASSLVLAGPDPEHLWVATDTGMILHLVP